MRASKLCFFLGLAAIIALLNGCAYSLHPLYNPGENVRDAALVGTWIPEGGKDNSATQIQENTDGTYEITGTDPDSPSNSATKCVWSASETISSLMRFSIPNL